MSAALNENGLTPDEPSMGHRKARKAVSRSTFKTYLQTCKCRALSQIIESDPEDEAVPEELPSSSAAAYNMDTDISQLEAPTFTTLDRGPSQKMIELSWDHKVNLIGKKVCF